MSIKSLFWDIKRLDEVEKTKFFWYTIHLVYILTFGYSVYFGAQLYSYLDNLVTDDLIEIQAESFIELVKTLFLIGGLYGVLCYGLVHNTVIVLRNIKNDKTGIYKPLAFVYIYVIIFAIILSIIVPILTPDKYAQACIPLEMIQ